MEKTPLKDLYHWAAETEPRSLAILKKPDIEDRQYLNNISTLSGRNEIFALYYLLNDPTLYVVKAYFSKSARCRLIYFVHTKEFMEKIVLGFHPFLISLLSDNQDLVKTYVQQLKNVPTYNRHVEYRTLVLAIFALLEGNLDEFDVLLNDLSVFVHKTKSRTRRYGGFVRVLDGIRQGAAASVVEGVLQLISTRKLRLEDSSYLHEEFGLVPHGMLKLSWLMGVKAQVDHPLIRQELLPIAPLESYPFYENLRFEV
jgi:hypothetical protein